VEARLHGAAVFIIRRRQHTIFQVVAGAVCASVSNGKRLWNDWFQAVGLDPCGIRQMQLDAYGALDLEANAAIAGHGVAMLSPFLFKAELASGRLVQPFDLALSDTKTYWLCYPPARKNAVKVKAFAAWIQAAVARELALAPGQLAPPLA
jgi:LysR family glycine cleavage system transcriptional activator